MSTIVDKIFIIKYVYLNYFVKNIGSIAEKCELDH